MGRDIRGDDKLVYENHILMGREMGLVELGDTIKDEGETLRFRTIE